MSVLDLFKLDGKIAFVTGSSTGLGQAMAIALAEAGADVICHASSEGKALETTSAIQKLGRKTSEISGDMADKETPKRLIDEVIRQFGRIDILINNAGTIRRSPAVDFSEEDWATVLEVNLSSIFRLS
jgi:2-dehydro-3-deoxy-D-gluconate 5-dehydrogenase